MALATENANLVRQKVRTFLMNANPVVQDAFMSLLTYYATQKGNPDLQFITYASTSVDNSGGHDLGIDAAHRVIGFYGKKANTATDVYLYLFDDATDDAGAGTDGRANLVFLEANAEAFAIYPTGLVMSAGVVVKAYTDFDGTTDSTDTDCPEGFLILAAA